MKISWKNKRYIKKLFKNKNYILIYKALQEGKIPTKVLENKRLKKVFNNLESLTSQQAEKRVLELNGNIKSYITRKRSVAYGDEGIELTTERKECIEVLKKIGLTNQQDLIKEVEKEDELLRNRFIEEYEPISSYDEMGTKRPDCPNYFFEDENFALAIVKKLITKGRLWSGDYVNQILKNNPNLLNNKRFINNLSRSKEICEIVNSDNRYLDTAGHIEDTELVRQFKSKLTEAVEDRKKAEEEDKRQMEKEEKEKPEILKILKSLKKSPLNFEKLGVYDEELVYYMASSTGLSELYKSSSKMCEVLKKFNQGEIKLKELDQKYFRNNVFSDEIVKISCEKLKSFAKEQTKDLKEDEQVDPELLAKIKAQEDKIIQIIEEKKELAKNEKLNSAKSAIDNFEV